MAHFEINGINSYRFVSQVAACDRKSWFKKIQLALPYTISASPKFNIRIINSKYYQQNQYVKQNRKRGYYTYLSAD